MAKFLIGILTRSNKIESNTIFTSACVLFRRENSEIKYLLLHYRYGHWGYTKGKIDDGETEKEAIIREIKEETGISQVDYIPGFKENIRYPLVIMGNKFIKYVRFFLGETKEKNVVLSFEHINYAWLNFEDAYNRLTYSNDKKVLKKADEFLSSI